MERKEIKKIPLEERIRRMQSQISRQPDGKETWRQYCLRNGPQVIGLQEYAAAIQKILEEPALAEELKSLESLSYYKNNVPVCSFFDHILSMEDEEDWCYQVYNCMILPFARIYQKKQERWRMRRDGSSLPFEDELPFD